jgi:hypothetical protein
MRPDELRKIGVYDNQTNRILGEIAAQLAELNDAQKPRWVKLNRGDGITFCIDAKRIRNVQHYHADGIGNACLINDDWDKTTMIVEPLDAVLKKLGIEVANGG